jgi:hypothetical protein
MGTASYEIVRVTDGWGIKHDGEVAGSYATKEVAFEMAALAASNAIKEGHAVSLAVPGVGSTSETALGAG